MSKPPAHLSVPDRHHLCICLDSVRFPLKAYFMGGPTPAQAEHYLLTKFGYTASRIAKLRPPVGTDFMGVPVYG